jgi:hypothetical protein
MRAARQASTSGRCYFFEYYERSRSLDYVIRPEIHHHSIRSSTIMLAMAVRWPTGSDARCRSWSRSLVNCTPRVSIFTFISRVSTPVPQREGRCFRCSASLPIMRSPRLCEVIPPEPRHRLEASGAVLCIIPRPQWEFSAEQTDGKVPARRGPGARREAISASGSLNHSDAVRAKEVGLCGVQGRWRAPRYPLNQRTMPPVVADPAHDSA